ncbi:polysaccharide deacetylase family protein [Arthrobacter sp. NPDC089319]|uniref:polysaccharide deacetylase family protein n=1 Tax=Arthrobacter sp. NPDC089319 TaxID=3155915 RepID=UPI003430395F
MRVSPILAVLAALALVAGSFVSSAQAAAAATYDERRGPNYTSRVILTYDGCPTSLTAFKTVLKYAKKKNDGLVLAPTGNCLAKYRERNGVDLAKLARAHGQYVINHSITHPKNFDTLSCTAVARELRAPGVVTNFGRPPYGKLGGSVRCGYQKVGMKPWNWTGYTKDAQGKSKAQVVSAAAKLAKPGATILMHMGWKAFNPDAIAKIKAKLEDRGLRVCRAYRGLDNSGAIITSPAKLPQKLPC